MIVRNKYLILEWIGAGGMAVVYRAQHRLLNEMRAVKVVSAKFANDDDFLKRFRHEAAVARRLRHENAVWVEDLDELEDGRPFIAMELLQGDDLRKLIKDQGPLAVDRSLKLGVQVASALSAAHKLGIVHRDIKPDNILITRNENGNEVAKVLDFGIAKAKEGALQGGYTATRTGVIIGTPEYMSPEQAEVQLGRLDGRSDIYSLGIVLYEMLTGQLPFKSDTPLGMCLHHLQTIPRPPHEVRPDLHIPESVSAVLMKALEKKRDQRFQSAQEMLAALHNPAEWAAQNATQAFAATRVVTSPLPAIETKQPPATIAIAAPAAAAPKPQPIAAAPAVAPQVSVSPAVPQPRQTQYQAPPKDKSLRWRVLTVALVVVICVTAGYVLVRATQRRNEALREHNSILQNAILHQFQTSPTMAGKTINVSVDGDVATLSGNVPLSSDKDAAGNLARSVDGIATVTNNIQVDGMPTQQPTPAISPPSTNASSQTEAKPAQKQAQGTGRQPPHTKVVPLNQSGGDSPSDPGNSSANVAQAKDFIRDGRAEHENGNYEGAIADFRRALQLDPGNRAAQIGIVRARHAQEVERKVRERLQQ
jgi:serine/threonine-protein kinase